MTARSRHWLTWPTRIRWRRAFSFPIPSRTRPQATARRHRLVLVQARSIRSHIALFNYKLPNGQYMIPSMTQNPVPVVQNPGLYSSDPGVQAAMVEAFPENAEVPGTALFLAHQAVANLDWNPNSAHSFSAKYYYQHDPTIAPYAYSMVAGFSQHLDAGSQVISLSHTQIVKSNLSITEIFGFIREKAYSTMDQPFTPQQFASYAATLPDVASAITSGAITADDLLIHNLNGSNLFPGISIVYAGAVGPFPVLPSYPYSTMIGSGAAGQGSFTGVFQNRFNPSANAIWTLGRHTITFGGSFAYTQMNTKDLRDQLGMIAVAGLHAIHARAAHRRLHLQHYGDRQRERQPLLARERIRRIFPGQVSVASQSDDYRRRSV